MRFVTYINFLFLPPERFCPARYTFNTAPTFRIRISFNGVARETK